MLKFIVTPSKSKLNRSHSIVHWTNATRCLVCSLNNEGLTLQIEPEFVMQPVDRRSKTLLHITAVRLLGVRNGKQRG